MMCDGTLRSGRKASNYRAAISRGIRLAFERQHRIAAMKILSSLLAICALGIAAHLPAAEPPKDSDRDQQQLAALAKEVQAQQTTIAENQKKIDEKTAAIGEALRLARIYAGRGR
jgi:hypothetical protein